MRYCGNRFQPGKRTRYGCVGMLCMVIGWMSSAVSGMTAPALGIFRSPEDGQYVHVSFGGSLVGQRGNMTYTIRGVESGGWKSELEWPIDSIIYGGGIVSTALGDWLSLNVGGWKSLSTQSGTMQDRDWYDSLRALLLALYGDDTAIYGKFDTTVDALKFDGNLRVDVIRQSSMALGLLAGYAYTQFKWVTGDGYQRSPLSSYNIGSITGEGIAYEQHIHTPYLGLAVSFAPPAVSMAVNVYALYSPVARCNDVDDHLVRKKESTGVTQGTFFSFGSDIHVRLAPSWDVTGTLNHVRYNLDGFQDQMFYGGENIGTQFSDIDMTLSGSQFSLGIALRYRF